MKKLKWLFIVLGIIALGAIAFYVINLFKNKDVDDSLIKTKTNMINNLNNFSYDALISVNFYGVNMNLNMHCKEDRVNKLGYCILNSDVVNIEEYMDYNNNVTYSNSDLISSFNSSEWKKENKKIDDVPMLKMVDGIKIQKKEKINEGTLYTGVLNGKSMKSILSTINETSFNKISPFSKLGKKIPVEVFVNNSNYIEYIKSDFSVIGIKVNMNINYHDFNTTESISLPEGIYELQN